VAIVAYQVHAVADTQIGYTWPFIELLKPKLFLPAHHDSNPPAWVDLGLEPMFEQDPHQHAGHGVPRAALSFAGLRGRRRSQQRQGGLVRELISAAPGVGATRC